MSEITSTHDIADAAFSGHGEPDDVQTNMVATKEAEGRGIEFHVSMRDYTQRDMEELIIDAAARIIVGRQSDTAMAMAIEKKCIELVSAKATAKLETITAEIIDQPVTPSYGDKKPVTMREMLGLYGREFLMEMVGRDGKPVTDSWSRSDQRARIVYLVEKAMDTKFKAEIEKSTNAVVNEIRAAIQAQHAAIAAELQSIRAALPGLAARAAIELGHQSRMLEHEANGGTL